MSQHFELKLKPEPCVSGIFTCPLIEIIETSQSILVNGASQYSKDVLLCAG